MKEITLKKTSDYSLFSMHQINRLIVTDEGFEPRKKLVESMKKHGFRMTQPIRCIEQEDGKMLIFDGHNRFLTAKFLNIPLWYISYPKSEADYIDPLEDNEGRLSGVSETSFQPDRTKTQTTPKCFLSAKRQAFSLTSLFLCFTGIQALATTSAIT